jgi:phosphoribosylanthranilate isomerase
MNRVKIKICGLTRAEDVKAVINAGVDAVGFVFTTSPRRISAGQAIHLCRYVPDDVLRVGLFLDQDKAEIEQVLDAVPLDLLQFHGGETEQDCKAFGIPYLKAVAMTDHNSAQQAEHDHPDATGLLLDSHQQGKRGGSGQVFDWTLSRPSAKQLWLAGGLNADNVSRAIRTVRPYAVDVSSGVETSPGIKDEVRINAFVAAVQQAGQQMEDE